MIVPARQCHGGDRESLRFALPEKRPHVVRFQDRQSQNASHGRPKGLRMVSIHGASGQDDSRPASSFRSPDDRAQVPGVLELVAQDDQFLRPVQKGLFRPLPHLNERHDRLGRFAVAQPVEQAVRYPEQGNTGSFRQFDHAFAVMLGKRRGCDDLTYARPVPQRFLDHFHPFDQECLFLLPGLGIGESDQIFVCLIFLAAERGMRRAAVHGGRVYHDVRTGETGKWDYFIDFFRVYDILTRL